MDLRLSFFLFNIVLISLTSCTQDELIGYQLDEYYECYEDDNWSVLAIRDALEGEWALDYVDCFNGSINSRESEGITIRFNDDSRVIVRDNGNEIEQASWQVFNVFGDYYELETEPFLDYTFGIILICNNQLVFNGSFIDACDQYYSKN